MGASISLNSGGFAATLAAARAAGTGSTGHHADIIRVTHWPRPLRCSPRRIGPHAVSIIPLRRPYGGQSALVTTIASSASAGATAGTTAGATAGATACDTASDTACDTACDTASTTACAAACATSTCNLDSAVASAATAAATATTPAVLASAVRTTATATVLDVATAMTAADASATVPGHYYYAVASVAIAALTSIPRYHGPLHLGWLARSATRAVIDAYGSVLAMSIPASATTTTTAP